MRYKIVQFVYNNAVSILKSIEALKLNGSIDVYGVSQDNRLLDPITITNKSNRVTWNKPVALVYYNEDTAALGACSDIKYVVAGSTMLRTSDSAVEAPTSERVLFTRCLSCIKEGEFIDLKAITLAVESRSSVAGFGRIILDITYTTADNQEDKYNISDLVYHGRPNFISLPVNLPLLRGCKISISSVKSCIVHNLVLHGVGFKV